MTTTSSPLGVTGNSEVIPLPDGFNDVPRVDTDALEFWRKRCAPPDDDAEDA